MQMPERDPMQSNRDTLIRKINRRWSEASKLPVGTLARSSKLESMLATMTRFEDEHGVLPPKFVSYRQVAMGELAVDEAAGRSEIDIDTVVSPSGTEVAASM